MVDEVARCGCILFGLSSHRMSEKIVLRLYCTCGAGMRWTLSEHYKALADKAEIIWRAVHSGPGHALCGARQAAKARGTIAGGGGGSDLPQMPTEP